MTVISLICAAIITSTTALSTLPIPAGTCTALPSTYPLYCLSPARSTTTTSTNTTVPPPAATQGAEVEMEYTSRKNGDYYFTSNYF